MKREKVNPGEKIPKGEVIAPSDVNRIDKQESRKGYPLIANIVTKGAK